MRKPAAREQVRQPGAQPRIGGRIRALLGPTVPVQWMYQPQARRPAVEHQAGIERLRARTVTAMMSLASRRSVELPASLRLAFEAYAAKASAG